MVIRIATGGTGNLLFPGNAMRQSASSGTAALSLGTFDFYAGAESPGAWCNSSCQMLGWRWASASMAKFIDQVVGVDRIRIREQWQQLKEGEMIDCLLPVRVDAGVRIIRLVAGRVEDGGAGHIAGLIQDVTASQQTLVRSTAA